MLMIPANNIVDRKYISLIRGRMKVYGFLALTFFISTLVFLFAWLDMVGFVNRL